MNFTFTTAFVALIAFAAAAPLGESHLLPAYIVLFVNAFIAAEPGDTAPVMSNGKNTIPFANTGNFGNAMNGTKI